MSEAKYTPDQPKVPGADVIYRPAGEAGEYAALATNPYRGCGHKCAYCLSPDTLILMADGTSRHLDLVEIGDSIIGIKKRAIQRRVWNYTYVEAEVLNKIGTVKQAYRITLEDGSSAVCSADHRWLTQRGWKRTDVLTLNNEIRVLAPRRKFEGCALKGSARIVSIEKLADEMPMIDISTTTENFIANGMISHNCYVPLATHQPRAEFDAGAVPRDGYMTRLLRDIARYRAAGICDGHPAEQVLITFSSDPFHPGDVTPTIRAIEVLAAIDGMAFCTLSKGGTKALPYLHLYRPTRDAYAATLTSLDDDFSRKVGARRAPSLGPDHGAEAVPRGRHLHLGLDRADARHRAQPRRDPRRGAVRRPLQDRPRELPRRDHQDDRLGRLHAPRRRPLPEARNEPLYQAGSSAVVGDRLSHPLRIPQHR